MMEIGSGPGSLPSERQRSDSSMGLRSDQTWDPKWNHRSSSPDRWRFRHRHSPMHLNSNKHPVHRRRLYIIHEKYVTVSKYIVGIHHISDTQQSYRYTLRLLDIQGPSESSGSHNISHQWLAQERAQMSFRNSKTLDQHPIRPVSVRKSHHSLFVDNCSIRNRSHCVERTSP